MKKNQEDNLVYGLIAIIAITLIFSLYTFFNLQKSDETGIDARKTQGEVNQATQMGVPASTMSLTGFDVTLAKQFVDKNNDGMCDFCGMRIEDCIASGMIQCSMGPNAQIGILGTQHI